MVNSIIPSHDVVLALGSNMGDRLANLRTALEKIREYCVVSQVSPIYETIPLYIEDQPLFYNAVILVTTLLEPLALLWVLKQLEIEMGRTPIYRYGPRLIDIDILFYDNTCLDTPELKVPHPRLAEREFVLRPLVDIMPDFIHPKSGQLMKALLSKLGRVTSQKISDTFHSTENHA